jgi:hypothetical protein
MASEGDKKLAVTKARKCAEFRLLPALCWSTQPEKRALSKERYNEFESTIVNERSQNGGIFRCFWRRRLAQVSL